MNYNCAAKPRQRRRKPLGQRTMAIRTAYRPGMSLYLLARQFGVSRQRVHQIVAAMKAEMRDGGSVPIQQSYRGRPTARSLVAKIGKLGDEFTPHDIVAKFKISRSSASRVLATMVQLGAAKMVAPGRYRRVQGMTRHANARVMADG
jgi:hypothetical protein